MVDAKHFVILFITAIMFDICFCFIPVSAQSAMTNILGRNKITLNGKWHVIIDPTGVGDWRQIWQEKKPVGKTDFVEYSFEGGPILNVPGDFNTQMPELTYMEGTVWYKKAFEYNIKKGKRLFIYFGAVNYKADVYLNGELIGRHEGGFTPFQFEITKLVSPGKNSLIVKADNRRQKDGLPGLGYDWFNYGGITRDVYLLETNLSFIEDYSIHLKNHSAEKVSGWVKLNGSTHPQKIEIKIPELNLHYDTQTNEEGFADIDFTAQIELWSPDNPRLYKIVIQSELDTIADKIGFRNIEVSGTEILLNGKHIFLKGVNIHEENPLKASKAYSEEDALLLLSWAKELGCNFVRLAHYPHNEYIVKNAEKMGLMVWSELPVYQHIEFSAPGMLNKMDLMLREMIRRDRNRCGVIIWSLSNETYDFTPKRNEMLIKLAQKSRELDSTRLITSVINNQVYENNTFNVWDSLYKYFDLISINEYLGWYVPWQGDPKDTKWNLVFDNKPIIISEFGGEALYGSNYGPKNEAAFWSEEYQEQIYKDQVEMFSNVPNLAGVCPWLLVDYRSLGRMHPLYQNGWNRKGLISNHGKKKKAWYIMKEYYKNVNNNF